MNSGSKVICIRTRHGVFKLGQKYTIKSVDLIKAIAINNSSMNYGKRIHKGELYYVLEAGTNVNFGKDSHKYWEVYSLEGVLLGVIRKEWLWTLDKWREYQINKLYDIR